MAGRGKGKEVSFHSHAEIRLSFLNSDKGGAFVAALHLNHCPLVGRSHFSSGFVFTSPHLDWGPRQSVAETVGDSMYESVNPFTSSLSLSLSPSPTYTHFIKFLLFFYVSPSVNKAPRCGYVFCLFVSYTVPWVWPLPLSVFRFRLIHFLNYFIL